MGKLIDYLLKQLKSEDANLKKDAEDCLKIYDKLKEMNGGKVWESSWSTLTKANSVGTYPNSERIYKPSSEGYIFLKGIEENLKEREAGVRRISIQMAIMSHLSDAQELMSMAIGNGMVSSGWVSDKKKEADYHINFAKQLVLMCPDTSIEVSENELNEIWKGIIRRS